MPLTPKEVEGDDLDVLAQLEWDAVPVGAIVRAEDGQFVRKEKDQGGMKMFLHQGEWHEDIEQRWGLAGTLDVVELPSVDSFREGAHRSMMNARIGGPQEVQSPGQERLEVREINMEQTVKFYRSNLDKLLALQSSDEAVQFPESLPTHSMGYGDVPNECLFLLGKGRVLMEKTRDGARFVTRYDGPGQYSVDRGGVYTPTDETRVELAEVPSDEDLAQMEKDAVRAYGERDGQIRQMHGNYQVRVRDLRDQLAA